jgi:hypothetical protein
METQSFAIFSLRVPERRDFFADERFFVSLTTDSILAGDGNVMRKVSKAVGD